MADYSLVSKDLSRIISEGVKALFKNYFKITSEKIKYNSSGKTEFQNSMGTSCKICSITGSPPLWNIKSSIILHDKKNTIPEWFQETISSYVSIINNCSYSFDNHWKNACYLIKNFRVKRLTK